MYNTHPHYLHSSHQYIGQKRRRASVSHYVTGISLTTSQPVMDDNSTQTDGPPSTLMRDWIGLAYSISVVHRLFHAAAE